MLKTYQSIGRRRIRYQFPVTVDGVIHTIDFMGGSNAPREINGTFTTRDIKIQDALESSERFNSYYKLVYTEKGAVTQAIPVSTPKAVVIDNTISDSFMDEPIAEEKTDEADVEIVTGISSGQKAKAYLFENFQIPLSKMKNNASVLAIAKECGVSFPELESKV